jgi:hypothetical protein
VAVTVVAVAIFAATFLYSPPAPAAPSVTWAPPSIETTVAAGAGFRGRVPGRGVGVGRSRSLWRVGPLWFMRPRRAA